MEDLMNGTKYIKIMFMAVLCITTFDVAATAASSSWFNRLCTPITNFFDRMAQKSSPFLAKISKRDATIGGIAATTVAVLGLGFWGYKKYQDQQKQAAQELQVTKAAATQRQQELQETLGMMTEDTAGQLFREKTNAKQREDHLTQALQDQETQSKTSQDALQAEYDSEIARLQLTLKRIESNFQTKEIQLISLEEENNRLHQLIKQFNEATEADKQKLIPFLNQGEEISLNELKQRVQKYIEDLKQQLGFKQNEISTLKSTLNATQDQIKAIRKNLCELEQRNRQLEPLVTPALTIIERSNEPSANIFKDTPWQLLLYTRHNASIFPRTEEQTQRVTLAYVSSEANTGQTKTRADGTCMYVTKETQHTMAKLGNVTIEGLLFQDEKTEKQTGKAQQANRAITCEWKITPENCIDGQPICVYTGHGTFSDSSGYGYDFNHLSTQGVLIAAQQIAIASQRIVYVIAYEWSGGLDVRDNTDRIGAGIEFAKHIYATIQKLNPIWTLAKAHSHGCNVLNTALQALKNPSILDELNAKTFGVIASTIQNPITLDNVWYISPPPFTDKKLETNGGTYNAKNVYVVIDDADVTGRYGGWWSEGKNAAHLSKPHSKGHQEIVRTITLKYDGISLNHINVVPITFRFLAAMTKYLHNNLSLAFETVINIVPRALHPSQQFNIEAGEVESKGEENFLPVWGIEGIADCLPLHKDSAAPEPIAAAKLIHDLISSPHDQYARLCLAPAVRDHTDKLHTTTKQISDQFKQRYNMRCPELTMTYKAGECKINEIYHTRVMLTSIPTLQDRTADPLLQEIFNARLFDRPKNHALHWMPLASTKFTPITQADGTFLDAAGNPVDENCMPLKPTPASGAGEGQAPTVPQPTPPTLADNPAAGGPDQVPAT